MVQNNLSPYQFNTILSFNCNIKIMKGKDNYTNSLDKIIDKSLNIYLDICKNKNHNFI